MVIWALAACYAEVDLGAEGPAHEVGDFGPLHREWWTDVVADDGTVAVPIEVQADTASLVATATSEPPPMLWQIRDPSGAVVLDRDDWLGDEQLTEAFWGERTTAAAAWPIREEDGALSPGTWTVVFDGGSAGNAVALDAARKTDADLTSGLLTVRIAWAAGTHTDDAAATLEAGLAGWADLWAPYGLTITSTEVDTDLDPELAFVDVGDPAIRAVAEEVAGAGEILVVVGSVVAPRPAIYGTSASIPGTVAPSDHAFVAIALDTVIGPDGTADDDEVAALATTLAHECGHYLGVPHPVEVDWTSRDALADTTECASSSECESLLGSNLMYPTALSNREQDRLTNDQIAVMQRWVGVR